MTTDADLLNRGRRTRAVRRTDAHVDAPDHVTLAAVPEPYDPRGEKQLDDTEAGHLATCEAAVAGLQASLAIAGKALATINRARLYRASHPTFEAYVEERWGMKRAHAYRMIEAWPVAAALSPIGDTPESHVRELLPAARKDGVEAAKELYSELRSAKEKLTAARVRAAVQALVKPRETRQEEQHQEQASQRKTDALTSLKLALKAQNEVWERVEGTALAEALKQDPEAAESLLRAIESAARRTEKRAARRP